MDSGIVTEAAFLLLLVGVAIYVVILYNELVRLRNDNDRAWANICLLYTSPSPRDLSTSRMPSSA